MRRIPVVQIERAKLHGHAYRHTRAFRQAAVPVWPFLTRGLVPLLLFLALTLFSVTRFASSWIEGTARDSIRTALATGGHGWAEVDVSGQMARLSGTPPSGSAGEEALSAARDARCPTWLGPKICALSVVGAFSAPEIETASQGATEEIAACEARLASELTRAPIEFRTGSANIVAAADQLLDRIAGVARECPGTLRIEGHTDNTGSPDANRILSQSRAEAVRSALGSRGVPLDRLIAVGLGQDDPLASNATAEGRARNRRIEFQVIPDAR